VTIIVSVKINDGIVMASDSASTLGNKQTTRTRTRSLIWFAVCLLALW
jgi:ATP-dependent protease HslVU (ClpYQ) peptidase subunit